MMNENFILKQKLKEVKAELEALKKELHQAQQRRGACNSVSNIKETVVAKLNSDHFPYEEGQEHAD